MMVHVMRGVACTISRYPTDGLVGVLRRAIIAVWEKGRTIIMADYVDRDACVKYLREIYCSKCNNYNGVRCRACEAGDVIDMIDDAPAADAEHVIRCKDCAKNGLTTCPICWIENRTPQFVNHDPEFYCGAAERNN